MAGDFAGGRNRDVVRGVTQVRGAESVIAGGETEACSGFAFCVERGLRQSAAAVDDADDAGGGKAVGSNDGDGRAGLGAAGDVASFHAERSLR